MTAFSLYNDEFEITRYFDFTFIDGSDFLEVDNWEKRIEDIEADGVVYAIIPKNEAEIKKLNTALSKLSTGAGRCSCHNFKSVRVSGHNNCQLSTVNRQLSVTSPHKTV
ncbi:MAG: hypothetical protein FWH05_07770 [Oscillospiraceae bacterium]|nr:hypothetical protein [Oscillospiraceae bacterium]